MASLFDGRALASYRHAIIPVEQLKAAVGIVERQQRMLHAWIDLWKIRVAVFTTPRSDGLRGTDNCIAFPVSARIGPAVFAQQLRLAGLIEGEFRVVETTKKDTFWEFVYKQITGKDE